MRYLYFYSPLYQFYHEHFQETLDPHFTLEPILIEDISEIQDKQLHHFEGLTIKIDLVIDAIRRYMGETILFSDATLFINAKNSHELNDYFLQYIENDIVFINEPGNGYNIGLMMIKCSDKTLDFFIRSLDIMKQKKHTHDQNAIKYIIYNDCADLNIKINCFSDKILCQYFYHHLRDHFLIWKSFISNVDKISNYNNRIQQFYDNGLIDIDTYHKWIK